MYGFVKYRPTKELLYVQWVGNVSYDSDGQRRQVMLALFTKNAVFFKIYVKILVSV